MAANRRRKPGRGVLVHRSSTVEHIPRDILDISHGFQAWIRVWQRSGLNYSWFFCHSRLIPSAFTFADFWGIGDTAATWCGRVLEIIISSNLLDRFYSFCRPFTLIRWTVVVWCWKPAVVWTWVVKIHPPNVPFLDVMFSHRTRDKCITKFSCNLMDLLQVYKCKILLIFGWINASNQW